MDGEFEQFEEVDDDILASIPLDFPFETAEDCDVKTVPVTDTKETSTPRDVRIPEKFAFPFDPYDIQVGFMRSLYSVLELGQVGIFESPTGTGKSLSLICGALTWLQDFEERKKAELQLLLEEVDDLKTGVKIEVKSQISSAPPSANTELDWIAAFTQKQEYNEKAGKLKVEQEDKLKRELRLQEIRDNGNLGDGKWKGRGKRKTCSLDDQFNELFKDAAKELREQLESDLGEGHEDDDVIVAEYHSGDETKTAASSDEDEKEEEEEHVTKIYYCSRTHTQLSQFVREIQKSPFGDNMRVVSLASRQNLCINEAVKRMKSLSLMNDRCQELQKTAAKKKKKKSGEEKASKKQRADASGCPFYKRDRIIHYRDQVLVKVNDIEQLVTIGRKEKACPYYGTRFAIPAAQLVALPYNTLLHRPTREACGIRLQGNIVIIDEAHNLIETINNVYSVEITGAQVSCAHSQLTQYETRYRSRLKANNLMYIRHLLYILTGFMKALGGRAGVAADTQKSRHAETRLQTINDFLFSTRLDNLNLFKVKRYCERSMISKKLHSFVEKYQATIISNADVSVKKEEETPTWALSKFLKEISQSKENHVVVEEPAKESRVDASVTLSSPLMHIEGFLEAITTADRNGRIVINKKDLVSKSSLKFLLLNPAVHFAQVVREARAVIVTSGTMQPLDEFKHQLFYAAGVKPERIVEFSCGHVIPASHLLPIAMARGSSGLQLDFTYQSRDSPQMMDELGRVVYNLCNIVPGGVVCFFPSYEYESRVYAHWQNSGFLDKMAARKKIYREPRHGGLVEQVLSDYTTFIKRHLANKSSSYTGALLLSVVGGRMSEGINFSDDLARCIVMVGLPYPNIRSPELKEKMDYLNANMPRGGDGRAAGQLHYENLCMKAVNQSIGRAIRHRADYAAILLLDHRYLRASVRSKLPSWIGGQLVTIDRFGPAFAAIRKFFADKAEKAK